MPRCTKQVVISAPAARRADVEAALRQTYTDPETGETVPTGPEYRLSIPCSKGRSPSATHYAAVAWLTPAELDRLADVVADVPGCHMTVLVEGVDTDAPTRRATPEDHWQRPDVDAGPIQVEAP